MDHMQPDGSKTYNSLHFSAKKGSPREQAPITPAIIEKSSCRPPFLNPIARDSHARPKLPDGGKITQLPEKSLAPAAGSLAPAAVSL
jgi:hypothetical protein